MSTSSSRCSSLKEGPSLEGIVGKVMRGFKKEGRLTREAVDGIWRAAAGEAAYRHSRPAGLKGPTLVVNVDGSSWLYELTMARRGILKAINDAPGGGKIKDIKLRIRKIE